MSRRMLAWMLAIGASLLFVSILAADQGRKRPPTPPRPQPSVVVRGEVFIGGYFYDPVFGPYPWWPRTGYPFFYYPRYDPRAYLRLRVTPDDAAVYVDGFYAGVVDDFDGVFEGLPITPGGHSLIFYLHGFRTARHNIYVPPGASFSVRDTLAPLPPGVLSEPPTLYPPVPPPPEGSYRLPRTPQPPVEGAPETTPVAMTAVGTLELRVHPPTSTVVIGGERWMSSDGAHFVVQLPAGTHRLEVSELGYQQFIRDVQVRDGETVVLNVTLVPALR